MIYIIFFKINVYITFKIWRKFKNFKKNQVLAFIRINDELSCNTYNTRYAERGGREKDRFMCHNDIDVSKCLIRLT